MALILGGSIIGCASLWTDALADERFRLQQAQAFSALQLKGMPIEARQALNQLAQKAEGKSLLHPSLLGNLENEYANCPWISKIYPFQRVLPHRVKIAYELRRPVVQVEVNSHFYRIDREGRRLPDAAEPTLGDPDLPLIQSNSLSVPAIGETWRTQELTNALAVLNALNMSLVADSIQVKSILIKRSTYLDRTLRRRVSTPLLDIKTKDGAVIRWGSSNIDVDSDELLNTEKLEMIRKVIQQSDGLKPGDVVDVRTRSVCYSPAVQ